MDAHELAWIGEHAPADAEMVRAVDGALAAHSVWDSLHHFMILAADKDTGRVGPVEIAAIDTAMPPPLYPQLMERLVRKHLATLDPTKAHTTVGCLLQVEASMIEHDPTNNPLTLGEQAAIERREMHTLARHIEIATVYAVDVGGRMWSATKRRGTNGDPDTVSDPAGIVTGHCGGFADALRRCADMIAPAYVAAQRSPWSRPKGRG